MPAIAHPAQPPVSKLDQLCKLSKRPITVKLFNPDGTFKLVEQPKADQNGKIIITSPTSKLEEAGVAAQKFDWQEVTVSDNGSINDSISMSSADESDNDFTTSNDQIPPRPDANAIRWADIE